MTLLKDTSSSRALPVLSLCVPTYKRPLLLSQSLRAILSQLTPAMAGQVEVVVLDNASPDETPQVVAKAQADFPAAAVRSVRRPVNIGADANFLDAVQQAQGEFVYLLSDDDVLLPGAVETLLGLIARHPDFDAFALNVRLFHADPMEEGTAQPFILEEDLVTYSRDEALTLLNTHLVFLSCMAFRRANVAKKDYTDKIGTVLIQAFFFVDAVAPGHGFYATRQPLLAQRAEHAGGYSFFRVFVTNFDRVLRYARQAGFSSEACRQVLQTHLLFLYNYILIFKGRGHYDELRPNYFDAALRVLRTYRFNPFSLRFLVPRLLLPPGFYRLAQRRGKLPAAANEAGQLR